MSIKSDTYACTLIHEGDGSVKYVALSLCDVIELS